MTYQILAWIVMHFASHRCKESIVAAAIGVEKLPFVKMPAMPRAEPDLLLGFICSKIKMYFGFSDEDRYRNFALTKPNPPTIELSSKTPPV